MAEDVEEVGFNEEDGSPEENTNKIEDEAKNSGRVDRGKFRFSAVEPVLRRIVRQSRPNVVPLRTSNHQHGNEVARR